MSGNKTSKSDDLDIEALKNTTSMIQASFEMKKACLGHFELPIGEGEDRYVLFEKGTKKKDTTVTLKLPLLKNGKKESVEFPIHHFDRLHYTSTKSQDGKFDFILGMNQEGIELFKERFPIAYQEAATLHGGTDGLLSPSYFTISCSVEELWMWVNRKPTQKMNCTKTIRAFSEIFQAHINRHLEHRGIVRANWKPLSLPRDPQNIINILDYGRKRSRIAQNSNAEKQNVGEEGHEDNEENKPPAPKKKRGVPASGRGGRHGGHGGNQRDELPVAVVEGNLDDLPAPNQNEDNDAVEVEPEDDERMEEMDEQPCTSSSIPRAHTESVVEPVENPQIDSPDAFQVAPLIPPTDPLLAHFAPVGEMNNVQEPNEDDFIGVLGRPEQPNPVLGRIEMREELVFSELQQIALIASRAVAERRVRESAAREVHEAMEEEQSNQIVAERQDEEANKEQSREDREESEGEEENVEKEENGNQEVRVFGNNQEALVEAENSSDDEMENDYENLDPREEEGSVKNLDSHEKIKESEAQITPAEEEENGGKEETGNSQKEPNNGELVLSPSNEKDNQQVLRSDDGDDPAEQDVSIEKEARETDEVHDPQEQQVCEKYAKFAEQINENDGKTSSLNAEEGTKDDIPHEGPGTGEDARTLSENPNEDAEIETEPNRGGIPQIADERGTSHSDLFARKLALEIQFQEKMVTLAESEVQNSLKIGEILNLKLNTENKLADIKMKTAEAEYALALAKLEQANVEQANIKKPNNEEPNIE